MNKPLTFIFLISISCSTSLTYETETFKNYLYNTHNIALSEDKELFVILSNFSCLGCIEKTVEQMNQICQNNTITKLSIITSHKDYLTQCLLENTTILYDSLALFDQMDIGIANATFIEADKRKLNFVKSIELPNIEHDVLKITKPYILN